MTRTALAKAAFAALALAALPVAAQELQRIAAIVNEDVISMYDLKARVDLVVTTSRLPDSADVRRRLEPQVLSSMIDEKLELQEAKRRNVSVTQADIDRVIASIEDENKLPKGGLKEYLKEAGLRDDSLLDQIRASIAWQKVIGRQFRPTVNVTAEEVDEAIARMKQGQGQEEARIGEILLTVDTPDEELTVRDNAKRLVEQIRGGARFDALARQFSQGPTASAGGDVGWINPTESEPAVLAAVHDLRPGQVSEPIRTVAGFMILAVRERRTVSVAPQGVVKVSLDQIFLPYVGSGPQADRQAQMDLAATLRETVSGCDDMKKAAAEVRSPRPPHLGNFDLKDLSPQLRELIEPLKVGEASRPLAAPDGVMLVMVCARDEIKPAAIDREQVEQNLVMQRLNMLARRQLRDLRRGAIVDTRV